MRAVSALPLRPLTMGEVLDAAVDLLRARAGALVSLGALVALVEQAVLYPLRVAADVGSGYWDGFAHPSNAFGRLVLVGMATEAFGLALLSGVAARRALPQVAPRRARPGSVLTGAAVSAIAAAGAGWMFLIPVDDMDPYVAPTFVFLASVLTAVGWVAAHGLGAGVTTAVVVDDVNVVRGMGRSIALGARSVLRAAVIRVLGYVAWLLVRLATWVALLFLLDLIAVSVAGPLVMASVWLLVNAIGYPVLACLNVALHVDVRVRTEGLDIALSRARDGRAPLAEVSRRRR